MRKKQQTVYIVDDDASVRKSLSRLLAVCGFSVEEFSRAADFLKLKQISRPSCLLLDVRLPDKNGLSLQRDLALKGISIPIIFISGHGDIPMSVKAIKAGAVDFLPKPFSTKTLFECVERAIVMDKKQVDLEKKEKEISQRFQQLTPREREVLYEVVKGKLNKQIAADLEIAVKTVKIHRGNVMRKMKASSVIELASMARHSQKNL